MDIKFQGKYKSITTFEWLDVPKFVVITGKNGTGKSHLLELLYTRTIYDPKNHPNTGIYAQTIISKETIDRDEVSYLKSEWNLAHPNNINLSFILQKTNELFNQFRQVNRRQNLFRDKIRLTEMFDKIEKKIGKKAQSISQDEFQKEMPEVLIENEEELAQKIAEIFYNYRITEIEMLSEHKTVEEIRKQLGEKPWIVLQDIIKEAKMSFEFSDPSNLKLRDTYNFKLYKIPSKDEIKLGDLSSGEKVIFSLLFLLYNSQEKGIFPKLMLMDEPDAHLHPSMSSQLINVLKNILVDKYGVRVIMTTHSPSTVIMSPDDSIFEMSHTDPRISKAKSKNDAVSLLTEGLVYVGEGTKYFIVEDNTDVDFYNETYRISTAEEFIERDIPMVFISASTSTKPGGKNQVEDWVKKLQDSGIEKLIQGIIDEDDGNIPSDGVYKINRYSIENYLLDPIISYAALMDKDLHNTVLDIGLMVGEEIKLKVLDEVKLQQIADSFFDKVTPFVKRVFTDFDETADKEKVEIDFILNKKLLYPKWVLKRKGKKILNEAYGSCFGTTNINYSTLFKALRKTNFIPNELSRLLDMIRR